MRVKDHERFKNVTAGVQSIVLSIAVVVTGIWGVYTFVALGTQGKAAAELERIRLENAGRPALSLSLDANRWKRRSDSLIQVNATVKNLGNREFVLCDDPTLIPLTVVEIKGFDDAGRVQVGHKYFFRRSIADSVGEAPRSWWVKPMSAITVQFGAQLPPAAYYVEYQTKAVTVSGDRAKDVAACRQESLVWKAGLVVNDSGVGQVHVAR